MAKKIVISVPEALFRGVESARKRARKDRSTWVQEAIAQQLQRSPSEQDIAEYIRGYTEHPESEEEPDDEWPEAPA